MKLEKNFMNKDFISKEKLREALPLKFIVPNIVTLCSLACGATAMRAAVLGQWTAAAALIIVAAFLDGLDGRIARMMSGTSKFGAELDSLSDFVSFGVSPAFVMYFYSLDTYPKIGWVLSLLLAICCALRLARFNTMLDEEKKPYWDYFFTGIPAPAGASIAILPLVLSCYEHNVAAFQSFWFSAACVFFSAIFMASRVPTLCLKKLKVRTAFVPLLLITATCYVALLFADFWLAISGGIICYITFIPIGMIIFYQMKKKYKE